MDLDSSLPASIRALPATADDQHITYRLSASWGEVLFITAHAGYEHSMHSHQTQDVNWVVSGELTLTTEEGEHTFGPSEWYEIQPGEPHGVRFVADSLVIELRLDPPA
jgi:quercetin dioxygenase-like cupin family protein